MALNEKGLEFLFENRMRDDRTWFHAHKNQYTELVVGPLKELAEELTETLERIDPQMITDPKRVMSRVYRDTRFSKDKTFYRDVMWLAYMRDHKAFLDPPAFFFEYSPSGFRYGCGYFQAKASTMQAMRTLILENDKAFRAAKRAYGRQDLFHIEGECFKRSRYAGQPEQLREWLERRSIFLTRESADRDLLFSPKLGRTLAEGFQALASVYHFFQAANQRRDRAD